MRRARGKPLHYEFLDEDFGQERPSYEGVPPEVEGDYFEIEGPFGTTCVIAGIAVDPDTVTFIEEEET
jgi:hypothetical protein